MSTLKDVAEMAGVSVSTVSYVLSGKKKVRPETLEKIQQAIRELKYQPNLLASSLKTRQSKTIGLVVSDLKSLFFVDILASMEEELACHGYCMIVCNADNDADREQNCLNQLLSRNIDGLILMGTGSSLLADSWDREIPTVSIDRVSDPHLLTVLTDHVSGGYQGAQYLISRGYRNIIFLGSKDMTFSQERYQGCRQAMLEAGLQPRLKELDTLSWEEACQVVRSMAAQELEFDAVFGCTDYIAIGAMKGLLQAGYSIPDQVAVLGYDDIGPAQFTIPELTTVAQPKEELGKTTVRCLLKLLRKEEIKDKRILLQPFIKEREST